VRWFEPSSEQENVNKFLVVYDDGTIYVFYTTSSTATNGTGSGVQTQAKEEMVLTFEHNGKQVEIKRDKVISTMQKTVEGFDFDKHYTEETKSKNSKELELWHSEQSELLGCI
jgi:hypothetical protein